jgi:L-ribulose-5-phosphate 4-epimerase
MKYESLRKSALELNLSLVEHKLVLFTWGNASIYDRELGIIAIKPSGIEYNKMNPEDIVVLDINGNIMDGEKKPSSDLLTHIVLYENFKEVNSIIHTHSTFATVFAQANMPIKCYGTTHADSFCGDVPVTRKLTEKEINDDYEKNTGKVIVELFKEKSINPLSVPACIVASHGPFAWGKDAESAIYHASILEHIAFMNLETLKLNSRVQELDKTLLEKLSTEKMG